MDNFKTLAEMVGVFWFHINYNSSCYLHDNAMFFTIILSISLSLCERRQK